MLELLQWHLEKDNRVPMQTKDGVLCPPEVDGKLDDPASPGVDKIVIYTYFIDNSDLIAEVRVPLTDALIVFNPHFCFSCWS